MSFFTIFEIIDLVVITFALGFIFSSFFKKPKNEDYVKDPIAYYQNKKSGLFNWDDIKYAAMIVGPAVILHEFGHKFVAMSFGATAIFNAAYGFLALGIILKLIGFPFIFFVPAYISWSGTVTTLQATAIAFAGPFVNLLIWVGASLWLKFGKVKHSWIKPIKLIAKINMFLFVFNMLPIPGFDGYHIFSNLISLI